MEWENEAVWRNKMTNSCSGKRDCKIALVLCQPARFRRIFEQEHSYWYQSQPINKTKQFGGMKWLIGRAGNTVAKLHWRFVPTSSLEFVGSYRCQLPQKKKRMLLHARNFSLMQMLLSQRCVEKEIVSAWFATESERRQRNCFCGIRKRRIFASFNRFQIENGRNNGRTNLSE